MERESSFLNEKEEIEREKEREIERKKRESYGKKIHLKIVLA